jgi:cell wall assembly regulator SMI1
MHFRKFLDRVRHHVEKQGVECSDICPRPASEKALRETETKLGIRIPAELREFYRTIGNGYSMNWQADEHDAKQPFGGLQVYSLSELAGTYTGWRGLALYTPERAEKYGFPYTKDPELAKRTAARQWHWLPIIDHANGDLICVDLSVAEGPVIFHSHDWLDGGTGDDGHVLATSWKAFVAGWGSVCFQEPNTCYWPPCFVPGGGVDWTHPFFRSPFRMGS